MALQIVSDHHRQRKFRRNEYLEDLLQEINGLLAPVEQRILQQFSMPRSPVVFVIGNPRCGKTLMMQWLAGTNRFCYPTNLLSRFYCAPYIGAKIQQLLADKRHAFGDEIVEFNQESAFTSDIGKTRGALSPNEFWYFWRRFFPYETIHYLDEERLNRVDTKQFVAELAAIEAVFDKPFALKAGIANLNVSFLSGVLDKALFLHVTRHPFFNIQSVLNTRVRHSGSRGVWWSFKPREYEMLKTLDPIEQIAGQVYFIAKGIEQELHQVDTSRILQVSYEDFCDSPSAVFERIRRKMAQQGCELEGDYVGPGRFECANRVRLPGHDVDRIIQAYERFSGQRLVL